MPTPPMIFNHKNQDKLINHLNLGNQVYIVGPTGSGKSQGVKLAADKLGKKFYKKLVGNQTTETSILGYMDASGRYVEGIAYKPFVEGGILLIDEVDNGNPNTNLVINGLSDRSIAFPCGMREAHKDFILIATANTIGTGATINYCGRNRLDASLLNRFIFLNWPYDEELEAKLTIEAYTSYGGTSVEMVNSMLKDILKIRESINELNLNHIVSPRTSMQAAKMLASEKFTTLEIFTECLTKGLDKDTQKKILDKSKTIIIKLPEPVLTPNQILEQNNNNNNNNNVINFTSVIKFAKALSISAFQSLFYYLNNIKNFKEGLTPPTPNPIDKYDNKTPKKGQFNQYGQKILPPGIDEAPF